MEPLILKLQLKDAIGNDRVKAALFYTFNFDPKFFENYVMPLLIPNKQFGTNAIVNNIIWRTLYKEEGKVPAITVYCDQNVKSSDNGPMLDYKIVCVNMPGVGKNKGNFHPKQSFILTQSASGEEKLIVITGSNNMSQGGWCENVECVSQHTLVNDHFFPYQFRKDIKDFIENVSASFCVRGITASEDLIISFLNKQGYTSDKKIVFYNSFQSSFQEFLDENIFSDDTIQVAEIISPFFKSDTKLVDFLINKKAEIRIQAPIRNDYCLMEKKVYKDYIKSGVKWYLPGLNRGYHSKIYRFYGDEKVYTIVGSVNFTQPAWVGAAGDHKEIYNIESAVLYREKTANSNYLLKKEIKVEWQKFMEPADNSENSFERFNTPEIEFEIDWINKILRWTGKLNNTCFLYLVGCEPVKMIPKSELELHRFHNAQLVLEGLSKRTIIKVAEILNNEERIHYYYPNQIGFEQKPLEYRLSSADIIEAWDLLGVDDADVHEWFLNRFEQVIDLAQDESGKIIQDVNTEKSLLNEMARHLYGLVRLEQYLFNEGIFDKPIYLKQQLFNDLRYYLTHDNFDTLFSYLKDIEKQFQEDKILRGYYWLLLQIIYSRFYENKMLQKLIRETSQDAEDRKLIRQAIQNKSIEIQNKITLTESGLDTEISKVKWAKEILLDDGIS